MELRRRVMTGLSSVRLLYVNPFAPFSRFVDGQDTGIALDITRAAFASQGYACQFRATPLGEMRRRLDSGEAEGIAAYGMSSQRAPELDFSAPYLPTGGCLFLLKEGDPALGGSGEGKVRISTPEPGPLGRYTRDAFPAAVVDLATDYPSALQAVREGRCLAAALNLHVGSWLAEELHPSKFVRTPMFVSVPLGIAVKLGAGGKLLRIFGAGLQSITDDGIYQGLLAELAGADGCPEVSWAVTPFGDRGGE
jgi:ABC-type amino acid transport substrate-binding protein